MPVGTGQHLANCTERVTEYEAAAPRRSKALLAHQSAGTAPLAPAAAPPAPQPPPAAPPLQTRPDGAWWSRARQASAPPSLLVAGRLRGLPALGGLAGAAAGGLSTSSTNTRPTPPSHARSMHSSTRPPTALAGFC